MITSDTQRYEFLQTNDKRGDLYYNRADLLTNALQTLCEQTLHKSSMKLLWLTIILRIRPCRNRGILRPLSQRTLLSGNAAGAVACAQPWAVRSKRRVCRVY
jgi:hypothetical protein